MNEQYKDKDWLEAQYWAKGLSTRAIASSSGVNSETIRKYMHRHGIPLRPATNVNFVTLTDEATLFLTGELLGDASLVWGTKGVSAYYSHNSRYKEYLNWLEHILLHFGITKRGNINRHSNQYGEYWTYTSRYYRSEFVEQRLRWYPDGTKIVPADLELSPITVLMWFLEDGSAIRYKNNNFLMLCTNGFTKTNIELLRDALAEAIESDNIYVGRSGASGYAIKMYRKQTIADFYDYIGSCPDEIRDVYGYKWNLREYVGVN